MVDGLVRPDEVVDGGEDARGGEGERCASDRWCTGG